MKTGVIIAVVVVLIIMVVAIVAIALRSRGTSIAAYPLKMLTISNAASATLKSAHAGEVILLVDLPTGTDLTKLKSFRLVSQKLGTLTPQILGATSAMDATGASSMTLGGQTIALDSNTALIVTQPGAYLGPIQNPVNTSSSSGQTIVSQLSPGDYITSLS